MSSSNNKDNQSIRYPEPNEQGDENGNNLLDLYKMNFYPGSLDYEPSPPELDDQEYIDNFYKSFGPQEDT